jgi:hypothetical protein
VTAFGEVRGQVAEAVFSGQAVVLLWCCGRCRTELEITEGYEWRPGSWALGAAHAGCAAEFVAAGWVLEDGKPPDVFCPHYWSA